MGAAARQRRAERLHARLGRIASGTRATGDRIGRFSEETGATGPTGRDGRAGAQGRNPGSATGAGSRRCTPARPGHRARARRQPGAQGEQGAPGATVLGSPGAAGPQGPAGATRPARRARADRPGPARQDRRGGQDPEDHLQALRLEGHLQGRPRAAAAAAAAVSGNTGGGEGLRLRLSRASKLYATGSRAAKSKRTTVRLHALRKVKAGKYTLAVDVGETSRSQLTLRLKVPTAAACGASPYRCALSFQRCSAQPSKRTPSIR